MARLIARRWAVPNRSRASAAIAYRRPSRPSVRWALQGVEIRLRDVVEACREGVQTEDFLLVEGTGGFYSPLTMDGLNADLATVLVQPTLLVTADLARWLGQEVIAVRHCGPKGARPGARLPLSDGAGQPVGRQHEVRNQETNMARILNGQ